MSNVYILAEIASAHMGSVETCKQLIQAAVEAGADGVKLQIWRWDEIKDSVPKRMQAIEFTDDQWFDIAMYGHGSSIDIWAECYGDKGLEIADKAKINYFKLRCQPHPSFWEYPRREDAVWWASPYSPTGRAKNLIIGKQDYPTQIEHARLDLLDAWKPIGYADHTAAAGFFPQYRIGNVNKLKWGFIIPAMAMARGATLIEKHICLNRLQLKEKSKDWVSALEPDEFKEFVQFMREAGTAL